MAWQYHAYGGQDAQHENWFLSVVLPRHPWASLLLSLLKRIGGRNRLAASTSNQDASTGSQLCFGAEKIFAGRKYGMTDTYSRLSPEIPVNANERLSVCHSADN
jgi:hypothetical protein